MYRTTAPTPEQPGRWIISEFGPPSVLKWETFNSGLVCSQGEAVVRILVAGISGADNIQRAGGYQIDDRCQQPGFTPGYDFVGIVDAIGPSATPDLQVGDLVTSLATVGGYGTHVLKPTSELIKLRITDDPIKTAALPLNYMTAYGMLRRSGVTLEPGSSVLISSVSGGVGTAVAQLARTFDMGLKLYGTCSPGKFDFVKSLGVIPIDRNVQDLAACVRNLNGGEAVNVAFDAVGSKESLDANAAAVKNGTGQVIMVGVMSAIAVDGSEMLDVGFNVFEYVEKMPRMRFWAATMHYYNTSRDVWLADFEKVLEAVRDNRLKPVVGKLFRLSEAVEANEMLVSGANVRGKMEFIVDADLAKRNGME